MHGARGNEYITAKLIAGYGTLSVFQRYYGKSLPFGSSSFALKNIGFLSAEQALADYAALIQFLRKNHSITKVVSLGGRWVYVQDTWNPSLGTLVELVHSIERCPYLRDCLNC